MNYSHEGSTGMIFALYCHISIRMTKRLVPIDRKTR